MLTSKMAVALILMLSMGITTLPAGQSLSIDHAGPVGVPSQPLNVTVVPGLNFVNLTWDAPADLGNSPISAYLIYIVPNQDWTGQYPDNADPIAVLGPEVRSYRHADLFPGNYYIYYIKAQNANGLSAYSDWVWARPGSKAPMPPVLYGTIGDGKASFVWNPNDAGGTAVKGFHIYRGLSEWNMTLIGTTEGWSFWDGTTYGHTTFTDTGLVNGVTYYYIVTAFNSMGESQRSNSISIQPLLAPSNLTASPNNVTNCDPVDIVVNWTFPAGNLSQIVGFRVVSDHAPTEIVAKENRSYTFHVSGGWGYSFRVTAIYVGGNESYSDSVFVGAPMCEGYGLGLDFLFLLIGFGIFNGFALMIAVLFILVRRKRRSH